MAFAFPRRHGVERDDGDSLRLDTNGLCGVGSEPLYPGKGGPLKSFSSLRGPMWISLVLAGQGVAFEINITTQ
jgi:hypothetical protein